VWDGDVVAFTIFTGMAKRRRVVTFEV